jgi:hypothetical protein
MPALCFNPTDLQVATLSTANLETDASYKGPNVFGTATRGAHKEEPLPCLWARSLSDHMMKPFHVPPSCCHHHNAAFGSLRDNYIITATTSICPLVRLCSASITGTQKPFTNFNCRHVAYLHAICICRLRSLLRSGELSLNHNVQSLFAVAIFNALIFNCSQICWCTIQVIHSL